MLFEAEKGIDRLQDLKTLGVEIAIDDFGTGYSSLEYLRRLPVDWLKIDRTFTHELGNDSNTVVLVDLMNQLAHAVGLRTVVEGIETEQQMATVRLLSCDQAQGFLISRPAPADEIEALISRGLWDGALASSTLGRSRATPAGAFAGPACGPEPGLVRSRPSSRGTLKPLDPFTPALEIAELRAPWRHFGAGSRRGIAREDRRGRPGASTPSPSCSPTGRSPRPTRSTVESPPARTCPSPVCRSQ